MGSTHVVEQLSFSEVPSILTFDFDLILGSFFYFLGPEVWITALKQGVLPVTHDPVCAQEMESK